MTRRKDSRFNPRPRSLLNSTRTPPIREDFCLASGGSGFTFDSEDIQSRTSSLGALVRLPAVHQLTNRTYAKRT